MHTKDIEKIFACFRKNYTDIPLEIFHDPYKILISTLLSSRTRDETTLKVSMKLFKKAPGVQKLDGLKISEIKKIIRGVGFYNTKALHLKKLSRILITKYNGKVPKTRHDLMKLPGVGRKTANLTMNRAFNIPAIAVDTHVHKISNLLGLVKTKSPEQTERILTGVVPRKYWSEINKLFVSIGRQFGSKKKLHKFLQDEGLI